MSHNPGRVALVLTGGGARGAYQAGSIQAIAEITKEMGLQAPFQVFTGTSAGAINASYLLSRADDLIDGSLMLRAFWEQITTDQVFRVDTPSLASIALKGLARMLTGGLYKGKPTYSLLDTAPLRELVETQIDFDLLHEKIDKEIVHSLAISTVNYRNGAVNTFFQTKEPTPGWTRIRRNSQWARLQAEHVMASTAIPMLFPPIVVGDSYYGDGALRNHTPLSPAIQLGADRLLVIGMRREFHEKEEEQVLTPSPGRILSILLNSIFLDALDIDYERLTRINHTLALIPEEKRNLTNLKRVKVCLIRPSYDIGKIALQHADAMPKSVKYLLRGLGKPEETTGLISYLNFESSFTKVLTEMGYRDTLARRSEIEVFFSI